MLPAASLPHSSEGGGIPSPCVEGVARRLTGSAQHPAPRLPLLRGRQQVFRTGWGHADMTPPHLPASPAAGVDGMHARRGENQRQATQPTKPQFSCTAPSWASVVRDRARSRQLQQQPVTCIAAVFKEDFFTLYERCVSAGLIARFAICHAAGRHEICSPILFLPPPPTQTNASRQISPSSPDPRASDTIKPLPATSDTITPTPAADSTHHNSCPTVLAPPPPPAPLAPDCEPLTDPPLLPSRPEKRLNEDARQNY
jgi:hypothetical protein